MDSFEGPFVQFGNHIVQPLQKQFLKSLFICPHCLHLFPGEDALAKHMETWSSPPTTIISSSSPCFPCISPGKCVFECDDFEIKMVRTERKEASPFINKLKHSLFPFIPKEKISATFKNIKCTHSSIFLLFNRKYNAVAGFISKPPPREPGISSVSLDFGFVFPQFRNGYNYMKILTDFSFEICLCTQTVGAPSPTFLEHKEVEVVVLNRLLVLIGIFGEQSGFSVNALSRRSGVEPLLVVQVLLRNDFLRIDAYGTKYITLPSFSRTKSQLPIQRWGIMDRSVLKHGSNHTNTEERV
eukprot:m.15192 g.15192  ORF g.15192 m.15192 type:complete len:298 (+) comp4434_c0_seq1:1-894(+)